MPVALGWVEANKPLEALPSAEVPISSTESVAFIVRFPPLACPKVLALTCAPSRIVSLAVSIIKSPAMPVALGWVSVVKLLRNSPSAFVPISSTDSEARIIRFPPELLPSVRFKIAAPSASVTRRPCT